MRRHPAYPGYPEHREPRVPLTAAVTVGAIGAAAALAFGGVAAADPVLPPAPAAGTPLPGLPGLPAIEQLSPVIQQAAADPGGASSLLMAAASAFLNSGAPPDSKQVADSVAQFIQSPPDPPAAATNLHVPTPGSEDGGVAHLPSGVNPAHAPGPVQRVAVPAPAPEEAAPLAAPETPEALETPQPAETVAVAAATTAEPPPTQDFIYPAIGQGCTPGGGNSIATALSVAGPAQIPTPGPRAGQTAYVFTAVGTSGPAATQKLPLNVTWVNLSTGKSGTVTLQPNPDINPEGPTTLTGVADTGSGSVMSTIMGQVSTKDGQCNFIPTIGSTVVP